MEKLLYLLEENARLSDSQLAAMLAVSEADIQKAIRKYEADGIISGYKALVNWDKISEENITALIELKVTPKADFGFEDVAGKIMRFPEVDSVYLMSGGFDLMVMVKGKNLREVASFVSYSLSTLNSVVSTATHFILKRYKEKGVPVDGPEKDEREAGIL